MKVFKHEKLPSSWYFEPYGWHRLGSSRFGLFNWRNQKYFLKATRNFQLPTPQLFLLIILKYVYLFPFFRHLLPLPTKFKSQGIVKHSADPVYLETIVIPFRGSSLSDFCLELCIVYSGPANVKNVLGGVRLSNGTGTGDLTPCQSFSLSHFFWGKVDNWRKIITLEVVSLFL